MIIKDGTDIMFVGGESVDKLKKGVYDVKLNRNSGQFFLRERQSFTFPSKVYGNDHEIVERVLKKYGSVDRNLGVLLTGIKGSGKTVTAKKICDMSGLPTLIISEPYSGEAFIEFMTSNEIGNCAVLIDEFEKIYNNGRGEEGDAGNEFLRILDGPYSTHNLFVFTTNSEAINSCLYNRPSRIFYRKLYKSVESDVIDEMLDDLLERQDFRDDFIKTIRMMPFVSFDILSSLINECNLFNEPASKCIKYMNIRNEDFPIRVFQVVAPGLLKDATYHKWLNFGNQRLLVNKFAFKDDGIDMTDPSKPYWESGYNLYISSIVPGEKTGEYLYNDSDGTQFIIRRVGIDDEENSLFGMPHEEGLKPGEAIMPSRNYQGEIEDMYDEEDSREKIAIQIDPPGEDF